MAGGFSRVVLLLKNQQGAELGCVEATSPFQKMTSKVPALRVKPGQVLSFPLGLDFHAQLTLQVFCLEGAWDLNCV